MKYIEQEYQQLLSEQRYAYERIINNLESHVNWLENELKKCEKDPLEKEIEEYNRLENESSESCPGCDARISELVEANEKLKAQLKKKPKTTRRRRNKNVVCLCTDCKKYFYAGRKGARRCPECKRKHAAELAKVYRAKKKM